MKLGRAGTMTHDYKRHGTTTLFAALNILDGTVIGVCGAKRPPYGYAPGYVDTSGPLRRGGHIRRIPGPPVSTFWSAM